MLVAAPLSASADVLAGATWDDLSQGLSTSNGAARVWDVDALASVTSAVPESEAYVLMLASLGAVGFAMRRRRRG